MPDSHTENVQPLASVPRQVQMAVLAGIAMFFVVSFSAIYLWSWIAEDSEPDSQLSKTRLIGTPEKIPSSSSRNRPTGNVDLAGSQTTDVLPPNSFQLQQDAIRQAKLARLRTQGKTLRQQWLAVQQQADHFRLSLDSLLTDERGKRIAASEKLIDQYNVLRDKPRPSAIEMAGLGNRLDLLLEPLDGINAVDLHPGYLGEIDTLAKELRSTARQFDQDNRLLDSLVSISQSQQPSSFSLQAAIDRYSQALAQAELKSLAAAKQQARGKRVAEMSDQAAKDIHDQAQADAEAAAAKRKYEQLKREALSPQVLTLLAPFTTPDYTQPRQVTNLMAHGEKTAKNEPVSLSRLQSLGVLDPTERGLKTLAILNTRSWTSRPRWKMDYVAPEPSQWSTQQFKMIRQTQEYLNKYGAVLVQEGKLAP